MNVGFVAAEAVKRFDNQGVPASEHCVFEGLITRALQILAAFLVGDDFSVGCSKSLESGDLSIQVLFLA